MYEYPDMLMMFRIAISGNVVWEGYYSSDVLVQMYITKEIYKGMGVLVLTGCGAPAERSAL